MAVFKKPYELSVWDETLGEEGQKEEIKRAIIGTHDMTYEGKARGLKLQRKLNGTHVLTFSLPSSFYDSKTGELIHNEFADYLFNERKLKLKFQKNNRDKAEWLEFYIKSVAEAKQHNSIMYTYTCNDAFIDELSRNGYGITFDTELYNNVEELGVFTETILEDSIWEYDASMNIGDFMEYSEEKLFKIPVSLFSQLSGYKINFFDESDTEWPQMTNPYTKEERPMSLADDKARELGYFWDNHVKDKGFGLLSDPIANIENDGYIYVPYNQLDFCYTNCTVDTDVIGYTATETPALFTNELLEKLSLNNKNKFVGTYCLAPTSLNPESLIQFIAIPPNAEVQIDEAQLLLNTNYTYVMKLKDWNNFLQHNKLWYIFENENITKNKKRKFLESTSESRITKGNCVVCYDGYLDQIGGVEVNEGKSISITDRTEINISEEIDQYVKVYNNPSNQDGYEYTLSNVDGWVGGVEGYRVCSKQETRQIIPQLARNLIQNGTNISSVDGWSAMCPDGIFIGDELEEYKINVSLYAPQLENPKETETRSFLQVGYPHQLAYQHYHPLNAMSIVNFGLVGQEKTIIKDKIYCLKFLIKGKKKQGTPADKVGNQLIFHIGEGYINSQGNYDLKYGQDNSPVSTLVIDYVESNEPQTYLVKFDININNPYFVINLQNFDQLKIYDIQFFEAYTKGKDFFPDVITEKEETTIRRLYRYSGREIIGGQFNKYQKPEGIISYEILNDYNVAKYKMGEEIRIDKDHKYKITENDIIFETDIMEGTTYEYTRYFIQQAQPKYSNGNFTCADTFATKQYTSEKVETKDGFLPVYQGDFLDDELRIVTNYIDLNRCKYYSLLNLSQAHECSLEDNKSHICTYQRYGYCPFLFQTEKHCRKIRTLKGEKSNRFNLTQELGKVFEVYPVYYIEHKENGKIVTQRDNEKNIDKMKKKVFYMTEKGNENKYGFKYQRNLKSISRTQDSSKIVTKLYVQDVDSELSKTGLCSIKTAEDNPSKDSFIIDFSYYYLNGMLNQENTDNDLYGVTGGDMGYLKKLGYYNSEYDRLSNEIINLQNESYTELEANIQVNLTGIETILQEIAKTKAKLSKYDVDAKEARAKLDETLAEQQATYITLLKDTFCNEDGSCKYYNTATTIDDYKGSLENYFNSDGSYYTIKELTNKIYELHPDGFKTHGMLGQYLTAYHQLQELKKQRAAYLKQINNISLTFYRKYEPYLKEGTWNDSNYITDNAYYHGAVEIAKQGAIPKLTYNISVTDLATIDDDYSVDIADTTYIEDAEMFGYNKKTGLPNKLKVIVSEVTYNLDTPNQNSIGIQNYTTQFEDLFQQVSASVQSLSFNENIYKRSSNFTATKNINKDSLQGTLLNEDVTLLQTKENNIVLDSDGQSGSDINNHNNKYKLNGQGLFFSNDGGQHWNTGVGPSGINADYIKVGTLDAGKIRIMDGNYLYFMWDKNGITAYRDPISYRADENIKDENGEPINNYNDYCCYNKNGLSVFEKGKIKLRAGYNYAGEVQGDEVGFYLYNTGGQEIFKTMERNNGAQLGLFGEMFVSHLVKKINDSDIQVNKTTLSGYLGDVILQNFYVLIPDDITPEEVNGLIEKKYCVFYQNGEPNFFIVQTNSNITIYNGIRYRITDSIENFYIYYKTNQLPDTPNGDNAIQISSVLKEENGNLTLQYASESYFLIEKATGNNTFKLYNKREILSASQSRSVVYVNNKDVNQAIALKDDFSRRIFSCLTIENKTHARNLLTILEDGSLKIGGYLTLESSTEEIDLESFPDIVRSFNKDNNEPNTLIVTTGGRLVLNGVDIGQTINDLRYGAVCLNNNYRARFGNSINRVFYANQESTPANFITIKEDNGSGGFDYITKEITQFRLNGELAEGEGNITIYPF